MINEYICYKCKCDKCGREWITKSHDVPNVCPKCHSVKWNEFSSPAPQMDAIRTPQMVQPSQPIKDAPKDALTAFIEKAQAKKGIALSEIIPVEVEVEPDWKFTKQAPQFADNGNVYRQQFRVSNGKPVYRNVEVDCDDLDCVK